MKKLLLIAIKDLKLAFRDRASLIFMLLAPFALTLGLGLVTGSFSGGSDSGISDIPVVVVDEDGSYLGNALVEMMKSEELADLLEPQFMDDLSAARQLVDDNKAVAAIYIPKGFTESIIPLNSYSVSDQTLQIELYGNPTSPTSLGIVKSILEQFMSVVETNRIRNEVTVSQFLENGIIDQTQIAGIALNIGMEQMTTVVDSSSSIKLNNVTADGKEVEFNMLGVLAPGMALMFLMYTVTFGGRSLLVEQNSGTLPRLLVSPSSSIQVLGGKVLGIFITGVVQMLILIIGTSLLFGLNWGDPLALVVLILVAVLAATSWGILLAASFKTPGQISNVGSALMLIFGILSGGFFSVSNMADWVQVLTRISPNRWGLDAFTTLAMGGSINSILGPIIALVIMACILFLVSVILFNRRGIGKR